MLKKIAVLLFALLIFQMAMYARLYADDLVDKASDITAAIPYLTEEEDADALIAGMGIQTRVNEEAMESVTPGAQLYTDPVNGDALIEVENSKENKFRLDIYGVDEGLIASFVNISSKTIVIDREMFKAGAYIYKLSGEQNIYCGTFVLR